MTLESPTEARNATAPISELTGPAGGIVGAGFDEFRWLRPGDELRLESEVLDVRPSKSRPEQGLIKVRTTTLNQNNEPVQALEANLVIRRRPINSPPTSREP